QLENIGNFLRAITRYGVKPHDIFEANDLFENTNHTQVQSTLIALASQAPARWGQVTLAPWGTWGQGTQGHGVWGHWDMGTWGHLYDPNLGTDQATISLQMGTNKGASQAGMTAPGTKRQIFEPALGMEHCDTLTIGLQMGSNKGASQQGMTVYGLPRQVYDPKYCGGPELLGHDGYDGHLYN
ncbi:CNN1 protein, partial [Paradoxornis webbianus]|nr:CNN1 protein [Sinosuthora webbiana]